MKTALVLAVLIVAALVLLAVAGGTAYVRLAPDDPARWHVAVPPGGQGGAFADLPAANPAELLGRLIMVAATTPRSRMLAGSVAEGRITWVVRSRLWGFPDYITAETGAGGLRIWSRQRYGRGDFGVNAARLKDWVARLTAGTGPAP